MSSPVTDGEQWSDELDELDADADASGHASPEGLGYAPLEYQVLDGEDQQEDSDENENESENEAGEAAEEGAASSQQPDVASAMLRAMEADYRACIESEARLAATSVSNGPVAPTTVEATSAEGLGIASREEHAGSQLDVEADGSVVSSPGQEQGESDGDVDGVGDAGEGLGTAAAEAPPPRRPISPLGQDQAERVMRAMQGFSLTPPLRPPAGFGADWESADALANLGARATTAGTSTNRGEEEGGGACLDGMGPTLTGITDRAGCVHADGVLPRMCSGRGGREEPGVVAVQ